MSDRFTRYVITLTRSPERSPEELLVKAHVAFLQELDRQGKLILAGPFEDGGGGMIVLAAESLPAAQAIAEADPFVLASYASCKVRTWLLSCEENDHMGMGQ